MTCMPLQKCGKCENTISRLGIPIQYTVVNTVLKKHARCCEHVILFPQECYATGSMSSVVNMQFCIHKNAMILVSWRKHKFVKPYLHRTSSVLLSWIQFYCASPFDSLCKLLYFLKSLSFIAWYFMGSGMELPKLFSMVIYLYL